MNERTVPVRSWSVPIAVDDVPETGRRIELTPDAATRAAIAKEIGVVALPRLEAEFDLTRHGGNGLRVVGLVSATVGQNCVVTLEPIQSEVDEAIDLVFVPQPEPGSKGPEAEAPPIGDPAAPPFAALAALKKGPQGQDR